MLGYKSNKTCVGSVCGQLWKGDEIDGEAYCVHVLEDSQSKHVSPL